MIYEIAGIKVQMEPEFDRLKRQCEAYQSSGEPVMDLKIDVNSVTDKHLLNRSDEDLEYMLSSSVFCREIVKHGRFFLHASAVVVGNEAYLFSAPSGTGKSTHTKFWLEKFKNSYILNDDKPVIFPQKDGVTVWGTPFSGKTNLQKNRKVNLRGICFLNRGSENSIKIVESDRAIALVLNNTYRPKNVNDMTLLLDMIGQVAEKVNIFEMSCKNEPDAAEMSYKAMKG
ncbi:MAG: hypothetical protein ACI3XA_01045 [Clostridia bacterium]